MVKRYRTIFIGFIVWSLFSGCNVYAQMAASDGFAHSKEIKSRYFDVYIESGVDEEALALKIAPPQSLRVTANEIGGHSGRPDLAYEIDALFLSIEDIMDLRPAKFRAKMKICKDSSSLSNVAYNLFGEHMRQGGFYVSQIDTLYVDAQNVNIYILGHEMSHAVQCHYFVVPTPVKIQEVLAGYVEFQLRKYTK